MYVTKNLKQGFSAVTTVTEMQHPHFHSLDSCYFLDFHVRPPNTDLQSLLASTEQHHAVRKTITM